MGKKKSLIDEITEPLIEKISRKTDYQACFIYGMSVRDDKKFSEIIEEGNLKAQKIIQDAKLEKDEIVSAAQTSAATLIRDACTRKIELITEGEFRKKEIITDAESTALTIVSLAKDAELKKKQKEKKYLKIGGLILALFLGVCIPQIWYRDNNDLILVLSIFSIICATVVGTLLSIGFDFKFGPVTTVVLLVVVFLCNGILTLKDICDAVLAFVHEKSNPK